MRIGFDVSKALAPRDGIGRYARELLRALTEIGASLELYGLPAEVGEAVARQQLGDVPHGLHWGWAIEPRAVDVFHSLAWTVPHAYRGPLVYTCHDLTFLTHPGCHLLDNKIHCLSGVLRANLAGAVFHAPSRATADELRRQLGISDEQTHVIPHAPARDLRQVGEAAAARVLERFGIGGAPVLAVGTLEPRKNLARLIDAYAGLDESLRQSHPLVLATGGGWKHQTILDRCTDIETAHVLSPRDDGELAALYSAAAVFAYPSLAEGFGLPVLEAMACGAPVVTSNRSSMPEVAGDAARLVDPDDTAQIRQALDDLLRRPDERNRLAALGRERAASFSWIETARQTLDLYLRVAAGSGPAAS
ncbi:MAG: glycosyltransferase family 4 protein [bacterium]|nr:glycosyltransferase family 4 protein [bacterium]